MTTSVKPSKDKTFCATPRLAPRQTAASAARAARNATNRNVNLQPSQRLSPSRGPPAPSSSVKVKSPIQRNIQKQETKPDAKECRTLQQEDYSSESYVIPAKQEPDIYNITDLGSTVIVEETSEERINYDNAENNETTNFDIKSIEVDYNELSLETVEHTLDNRSRPQTPAVSSRPPTPMNNSSSRPPTPMNSSSRPPTPRVVSRPRTPAQQLTRSATPNRPNTPQRIPTPTQPNTTNYMCVAHTSNSIDDLREKDIKAAYTAKQKQFKCMKRDLDLKQQAVLEVFGCLRGMRERMALEGVSGSGEGIQDQELMVFNVADWSTEEITQLCRDAAASSCTDGAVELINTTTPIDECIVEELDAKIVDVPKRFANFCLQTITARQELINWVMELIERNEDGSGESTERIAHYNAQGLELCEALNELKDHANDAMDTAIQLSRRAFRERNALIGVGESLVREIARLREDLETRTTILTEVREIRTETEISKMLEEARREVGDEKAAKLALNNKLASTEAQLRQARGRINKMDRQLREADASITSLTATVKSLEDQSRQKEVQLEARARKLRESLKTGEVTSSQLAQHRDALQVEILELREQIEKMTNEHKTALTDLNKDIRDLKKSLESQEIMTLNEKKCKEDMETALEESQIIIEDLRSKITKLENSMPNPDLPTEREMDLWAELQATKETLRMTEDEVTVCKREKVRFLETMTKITETDNKVGMQQKLAAELLSKEEIISKMQIQIRELTKNIKLHEQKVIQYEQYVRDLQAHNRAVANCQEAPNGISYQDLQQEIMNLKMSLLEAVHRNEELSEILVQKEQQLEQQDKTSRAQARVIKVREELINMLKNKETEQSRELSSLQQDLEHRMKVVEEVNKQIAAKAEEIQELFATLENKQQQIHRLEKIVLALEEQQRRAQAQRTRHEEKIAALEHELASGGNRRERKFLFF